MVTRHVETDQLPPGKTPGPGAPTGHLIPEPPGRGRDLVLGPRQGLGYGFAAFSVDPGDRRGGETSIDVTYYQAKVYGGDLEVFDSFTLTRPRKDG
jgi:hypothetical protein